MSRESLKKGLKSGYHHHWKLMTATTVLVFFSMVFALMKSSYMIAGALLLAFLMLVVQWLTIDPPDISDRDVHGPGAKDERQ